MDAKTNIKDFIQNLDDGDIYFETESKDDAGKFISVYTMDTYDLRSLLSSDKIDYLKGHEEDIGEYGETYAINFYTEYYPYTEDVAIKVNINIYDMSIEDNINQICKSFDRIKDGYIVLTNEEKDIIRDAVKEYASEEIEEFLEMNKEEERD